MQKLLQKNLPQLNLFVSTANSGKDNTTASTPLAQCNSVTPHQSLEESWIVGYRLVLKKCREAKLHKAQNPQPPAPYCHARFLIPCVTEILLSLIQLWSPHNRNIDCPKQLGSSQTSAPDGAWTLSPLVCPLALPLVTGFRGVLYDGLAILASRLCCRSATGSY